MPLAGITPEFMNALAAAVRDGGTYPLLDQTAADLMKIGLKMNEAELSESGTKRGKQAGIAAHLLTRLPSFENAPMDEVLSIRRDLERPLVNFRAAMMGYGKEIASAAWDEDFIHDAEALYREKVAPAILQIEDAVQGNRPMAAVAQAITTKPLEVRFISSPAV